MTAETITEAAPEPRPSIAELYAEASAQASGVDGLSRFSEIIEKLGAHPSDFTVSVSARRDGNTWSHLRAMPFDGIDEDGIAKLFGPGHYRLTLKGPRNRIVTNCTVTIDGDATAAVPERFPGSSPTETIEDRVERAIERLVSRLTPPQTASSTIGGSLGEIAQVITAMQPRQPEGIGVKDLVSAFTALAPLILGSKPSPLKDLMQAMQTMEQMRAESGVGLAGGGDDTNALAALLGPLLTAFTKQQQPVQVATPPSVTPPRTPPQPLQADQAPPAPHAGKSQPAAPANNLASLPSEIVDTDSITQMILFGTFKGVSPHSLAPSIIELIDTADAATFSHNVPSAHDASGLAEWLLSGRGDGAHQLLAVTEPYVRELAAAVVIELEEASQFEADDASEDASEDEATPEANQEGKE